MPKKTKSSPQPALFHRDIPQMPDGYYSSGPNPNLHSFMAEHATPYNLADDEYDVLPFDQPISTSKATAIYNMHTYWSKKPHDAIQQYIKHYTQPGDLVLDPFCGSGGTALAALMEGRAAIAIDLSPAATFITKNYCTPVDIERVIEEYSRIRERVTKQLGHMYSTVDKYGNEAQIRYTTWSETIKCIKCLEIFPLVEPDPTVDGKSFVRARDKCPFCSEPLETKPDYMGMVPVRITYSSNSERRGSRDIFTNKKSFIQDREKALSLFHLAKLSNGFSEIEFPIGTITRQPINMGLTTISSIYTGRNFTFICMILQEIQKTSADVRDFLLFCFEGILLTASKMYKEQTRNIQSGTYYCPPIMREVFPFNLMNYKIEQALLGVKEIINNVKTFHVCISTQDSKKLDQIPTDSIDYIFTDPPYSGKVQYAEANFVWESVLGFSTAYWEEEIIISGPRKLETRDWESGLFQALKECYRVLKPGHYISLCYHDVSSGTWELLQDIVAEVGFVVADKQNEILFIEVSQKSHKQRTSDTVQKRDLVINFRKPREGEIAAKVLLTGEEDPSSFSEKAQLILREALERHPGAPADRLYDELVSRMVRKGQFQRHNFDELLRIVADETGGRWYLLDTADQIDETESKKENAAATRLEAFMQKYLKKNPSEIGIHYSYLFEEYLPVEDKPRRLLQDWLPEYFYKTEDGTWRPPINDEEHRAKTNLRLSGELRHIKRFANALNAGVPPAERDRPSNAATLAEWIYQCRRSGLYDLGRILYERGGLRFDSLKEERQLQVEEDYQICVKRGSPAESKSKKTKKKVQRSLFDEADQ